MSDFRRSYIYPLLRLIGRLTGRHVSGAYCWCRRSEDVKP